MKFPYGLSDFATLITENYFYQDRTFLIPAIERAGKQLLFLRPRRFGKSLLLSMLENYYDLRRAAQFEQLFGHLAIGQNPTPLHHRYLVMKWDFSLIKAHGDLRDIETAIHQHLNNRISDFCRYYAKELGQTVALTPENAIASWEALLSMVRLQSHKLYLLIDEYDNFANEVMLTRPGNYEALLYGEGLLKTVFKAVKAAAGGMGLDRVFITGVSPVVLSDMTSGYNVAENIYLLPEFNTLCGFTENEIENVLKTLHSSNSLWSVAQALDTMRTFYNGYCFSDEGGESVYNPTLSLYFLKHLVRSQQLPTRLLDENLAMDRNKLSYIAQLPHGPEILLQALDPQGLTIPQLAQRFGVEEVLYGVKDKPFMASLLYYFGILTLAGVTPFREYRLTIPNLVVRELYLERLQHGWLSHYEDRQAVSEISRMVWQTGDLQPLCAFIEQRYLPILSNRDYRVANELIVKVMFMTLLHNDHLYMMVSELEVKPGYLDLALIRRPDARQSPALDLLFEFKYLSLNTLNLSGEAVKHCSTEQLAQLPPVQTKLHEASEQALRYGAALCERYGLDDLRLYAVVGIGLERVVWQQVTRAAV